MVLQEALEIQDLQVIGLRQSQELAQRGIGLDILLLHQTLLARVGADTRGDLRAADQGASRDTEELAQVRGDGRGDLEDGGLLGLVAIGGSGLAVAATLLGALQLARHLLLQNLQIRENGGQRSAQAVDLLNGGSHAGGDVDLLDDGIRRGGGGDNGGGDRRRRSGDHHGGRGRGSGLGGLGRRRGSNNGRGNRGSDLSGGRGGGLRLTTSRLGGSGRGHFFYIGCRGSF